MNLRTLMREALATAWASKVPSTLVCLITAAMCIMTISTVGRTAAAENQVAQRINSAGARELVVTDKKSAGLISSSMIDMAANFSVADRAVGLSSPVDVKNSVIGDGAEPVPAWAVIGDLQSVVHLESGRAPGPGEALVSTTALAKLGMQHPVGAVSISNTKIPLDYAIVGSYTPLEPFDNLGEGIVFNAPAGSTATNLHLILRDSSQAAVAQRSVIGLFGQLSDPEAISVRSPLQLAQLHDEIVGDLGAFGRSMLYGSLGIGALLVAVVVFADILVRRKDLGRRRALGATRSDIVQLMLLRTLVPAAIGALMGIAVGLGITVGTGTMPPLAFCFGIVVLALFAAGASTLAPAAYAAYSDPVKVLRTP